MKYADLKDKHIGGTAIIVGKGPSLDNIEVLIDEIEREGNIAMALNEAIFKVEALLMPIPVYCVQQDSALGRSCVPGYPDTIHLMNSWQSSSSNPRAYHKRWEVSEWNPDAVLYDFPETNFSAEAALKIAKHMGCEAIVFMCFDSWADEKRGQYAECIGEDSGELGDPARHAVNGCWIREVAKKLFSKVSARHPDTPV